ncbi:MAG: ATP phosphoribosyltransferase [Bacteroidales bacterium]
MLRIAVQSKGRLFEDTMELLKEAGIKLSPGKRTLLIPARNFPLEILYLRDDDIPDSVATNVADVGIVGLNEYAEKKKKANIIRNLGFSKCHLSLAIPKDENYNGLEWFNDKKIATSYPLILEEFLTNNNIKADIHVITGSVEIAPGIGLADGIFDIVSSGSTLISNRLKEVEVVMDSEAVLIANPNLSDEKREILEELLFRINAVQEAEDKKYVLMNVADENLQQVLDILPGIKSPTVMPLANAGWHSVHTVLPEKVLWQIIGRLKAAGAEGILALNIEKMIL